MDVLTLLFLAAVAFGIYKLVKKKSPAKPKVDKATGHPLRQPPPTAWPAGFDPDYIHDNIAIDTKSDQVWLRERREHRTQILPKSKIKEWQRRYWQGAHKGASHVEIFNHLQIDVADMDMPRFEIAFHRAPDEWDWPVNARECKEWASRLSTWING